MGRAVKHLMHPGQTHAAYYSAMRELCGLRPSDGDLRTALNRAGHLAVAAVNGVDAVSSVVGPPERPALLASSSVPAQSADGLQHLAGHGPVFDAVEHGVEVCTEDLFADPRWPRLSQVSGPERVVAWTLAVPLRIDGAVLGAMTFYAGPDGPDRTDTPDRVRPFAAAAAALIRDATDSRLLAEEVAQLRQGLTSRAVIDQAKGMIMMARRCDADEAFAVLQRISSTSGRKIREVAQDVVSRQGNNDAPPVQLRRRTGG